MQNYTPPGGWGPVLHFLHEHRLSIQAALTAFCIAIAFSLWDGLAWRRAINAGFICFFVALAVSAFLEQLPLAMVQWSSASWRGSFILGDSGLTHISIWKAWAVTVERTG
ncbi:phage holin family protein [Enterobacter asburiae]|uniref:phage holin family protein n=1 Tax=Enterobacter asburiae TaxID=61645 RepID=UPI00403D7B1C